MVDLDKAATGLVKFYVIWKETGENYTVYMDVVDGHVETFTNSIAPGNYTVVATYMGDSVFNTNTTSKDVEILGHVLKDTPITANVAMNGNRVTLTAKVDENATGFVELKFGDNVFNIALKDGVGTLTTSLPYGSYSLDITYLTANGYGGAIYNGGEANIFNSTFTGASSEKDGGAIYNNDKLTVDNSTFVGDTATGNGGAIYNNKSLVLTKSIFGINFAEECANIYNAGNIQFSENTFDFYDVILVVPDGQYGIPTTITGTLNPEFNMDLQLVLPGFVNYKDATVTISDGVFEYVTDVLPKGVYDVKLDEILYDNYGNIYYGEEITDRLIIHKANVYINVTVEDVVIRGETGSPVLKIDTSKTGSFHVLFNNRLFDVTVTDAHTTLTLDAVGEGK